MAFHLNHLNTYFKSCKMVETGRLTTVVVMTLYSSERVWILHEHNVQSDDTVFNLLLI